MSIQNHVTSLELSKQLYEAGIVVESEFYWSNIYPEKNWDLVSKDRLDTKVPFEEWTFKDEGLSKGVVYPAPLSSELGELLPVWVCTMKTNVDYYCWSGVETTLYDKAIIIDPIHADTEANARAKMLLYLKEKGLLK